MATKKKAHPHQGQHAKDDQIALALAAGETAAEAASGAGVSVTTVRRRLKQKPFCDKVLKLRDDMTDRAIGVLAASATRASIALQKLLANPDARIRLNAAKAVLSTGIELRAVAEFSRRLQEIEATLKERDRQQPPPNPTPFGAEGDYAQDFDPEPPG